MKMYMKLWIVTLCASLAMAGSAFAATFQVEGSGTVNVSGPATGVVADGSTVDFSVLIDVGPGDYASAVFTNISGSLDIAGVGSFSTVASNSSTANASGTLGYGFTGPDFAQPGVTGVAALSLSFDVGVNPFLGDELNDLLTGSTLDSASLRINVGDITFPFSVTLTSSSVVKDPTIAVVPLPAAAGLLLMGISSFGVTRFRRREIHFGWE